MTDHVTIGDGTVLAVEVDEAEQGGNTVPTIVLHPGLGYASWCFRPLAERLRRTHRVVRFDPRGAGQSDKPAGPYSIAGFADDVAGVVDALGVGPVHVLGHSMGGYVAQLFGLRHSALTRSLVLVATSPGGAEALPVPETTRDVWLSNAHLEPADYARATFPLAFRPGFAEADPGRYEEFLAARLLHPTPSQRWLDQFEACETFLAAGAPVEALAVPVLVIHGNADRVVPRENGRLLAERIAGARLQVIDGGGHNVMLEDPDGIAALVDEFTS